MILLKEDKIKKKEVWKYSNYIQKIWYQRDVDWLLSHVKILNKINPGYILSYGSKENYIYLNSIILPGTSISVLPHNDNLIKKVYNFCFKNLEDTKPYVHGDWVVSNMIIHDDVINLCDWDNVGIYNRQEVINKIHDDLYSSFGERFKELGYLK